MAHGIAGVLATLAITLTELGPFRDSVAFLARRLLRASHDGVGWPPTLQCATGGTFRSSWCYGGAGTTIALYQIALRTADVELEAESLAALARLAKQRTSDWQIDGQGICHGRAGVALVFGSAARSGVPVFAEAADRVVLELVQAHSSDGRCIDELNGSAGVALTLLTLAGACDDSWMRLHGLDPIRRPVVQTR
jgi:hypothetical protein